MQNKNEDMNKALFINLVSMLSMSAMQELGKLKNPFTGKTEVHLDMAQATIDMLDMLEAKTRGNREADEDKLLKDTLTMLKMNYVETKEAAPQKTEPQKSESQRSEVSEQKDKGKGIQEDKPSPKSEEPKDPKFHKTYS